MLVFSSAIVPTNSFRLSEITYDKSVEQLFGLLTSIALLIGFTPYLIDIFRGKTKPERTTWFLWSVLGTIAFFSLWAEGATWSLILPGLDTLIVITIFVLSIPYGVGGLIKRDIISLVIALFGLLLWLITKEPLVALVVTLGVDSIGAMLTVIKTYEMPESETLFAWCMAVVAGIFGALSVGEWAPSLLLYPAYIIAANAAVAATILLGRKRRNAST